MKFGYFDDSIITFVPENVYRFFPKFSYKFYIGITPISHGNNIIRILKP